MLDQESIILNSKIKDSSAKKIFEDPLLCAQFLRDYIKGIPCLESVSPDDIEDVSGQFVPLFSEERNSDSVKRIRTKDNEESFFVISLIEHKTYVEYNISMQIFRYMIYIWEAYEKEMESAHEGISHTKSFRYPPILPIVYYEGSYKWNAPLDFVDRINKGEYFSDYLPNFKYYLIQLNDYSNRELLEKRDEISLVMLINKLQTLEDISRFRMIPPEKMQEILSETPDRIVKIIADILLTLLLKINVPEEKAEDIVMKVREKKMGQLFENFEPVDIQEEWRKLDAAKAEMAHEKNEIAHAKAELTHTKNEIASEKRKFDSEKTKFDSEKTKFDSEKNLLLDQKTELHIKEENLLQKESSLQQREDSLLQKEDSLQQKTLSLQQKEVSLQKKEESLQLNEQVLQENKSLQKELEHLKQAYEQLKKTIPSPES